MFLGSVGRLEAQLRGDLCARRRIAGLADVFLDEIEDFLLAGGELLHGAFLCMDIHL